MWVSLVGMTVWWTLGFNATIYLAGLTDIPRELYEAAEMDGASRSQQFWNVTLPGLRPVLVFVVTTTILASANMFGQQLLLTKGAPGHRRPGRSSATSRPRGSAASGWARPRP